jgi:hypothetical protein
MSTNPGLTLVAAVNSSAILEQNLLRSPLIAEGGAPLITEWGHSSAGAAYNAGLSKSSSRLTALVHQDIYLPGDWEERVLAAAAELDAQGIPWGVLGVWGIRADRTYAGRVWCSGGGQEHCVAVRQPVEVVSIDEIVIVLNCDSGLRFDEGLPGYHLYGTDIIMQARQRGLSAFVFPGPVVHNSRPNPQVFDRHFFAAYRYMQRKWAAQLPLLTCTVPVTASGWPLYRAWMRREWRRRLGLYRGGIRQDDPRPIAQQLGYEAPAVPI